MVLLAYARAAMKAGWCLQQRALASACAEAGGCMDERGYAGTAACGLDCGGCPLCRMAFDENAAERVLA